MTQQNALSRRQFRETKFNEADYKFNTEPGEFVAAIDCKRWGKRKKLITYMTFADGRKIVALTWPRSRYEGLASIEVGSKIRVLYKENRSGTLCVRRAVLLAEPSGMPGAARKEWIRPSGASGLSFAFWPDTPLA